MGAAGADRPSATCSAPSSSTRRARSPGRPGDPRLRGERRPAPRRRRRGQPRRQPRRGRRPPRPPRCRRGGLQEPRPHRLRGPRRPREPARPQPSRSTRLSRVPAGPHRPDRLHGRRARAAHPRAGRGVGARPARSPPERVPTRARSTSSSRTHNLQEQGVLNGILAAAAADMGLPLVASNDAHFSTREDGEGQLYLSCIAQNRTYAEAEAAHHGSFEMFLKSPEEMSHLFRDRPEAVKNTLLIAERLRRPQAQARRSRCSRPFPPARGDEHLGLLPQGGPRRARAPLRGDGPQAGEDRRERLPPAPGDRELDVIVGMGLPRLLPHRVGLHPIREGKRDSGGPRPRLRRRI